ncbi:hypothetical protein M758_3G244800 [Ceratodon purpureus]|nr:hypothetical protein M758_3G244800 [Ceratodon purpureus]
MVLGSPSPSVCLSVCLCWRSAERFAGEGKRGRGRRRGGRWRGARWRCSSRGNQRRSPPRPRRSSSSPRRGRSTWTPSSRPRTTFCSRSTALSAALASGSRHRCRTRITPRAARTAARCCCRCDCGCGAREWERQRIRQWRRVGRFGCYSRSVQGCDRGASCYCRCHREANGGSRRRMMVLLQKTSIQWKRITSNDERLILERRLRGRIKS